MRHQTRADIRPLHLAQFEHQCVGDMLLLDRRLADVELPGLAVMVAKTFGPQPGLRAALFRRETSEAALGIFARATLGTPAVGFVIGAALRVSYRHRSEEHTSELQSLMRI